MVWQRQLDQNAMNGWIFVQDTNAFEQLGFGEIGVVFFQNGTDAVRFAGTFLVQYVHHGGRAVADQNNSQSGEFPCCGQFGCTCSDIFANFLGQFISVDNLGSHFA